jgi:hypothetical protein
MARAGIVVNVGTVSEYKEQKTGGLATGKYARTRHRY